SRHYGRWSTRRNSEGCRCGGGHRTFHTPRPQVIIPSGKPGNCSTDYLERQQPAYIAKKGGPSDKFAKCIAQFTAIEQKLADAKQASNGRLKLRYLKASPLELEV
ncbi:hypothetical protein, partial [Mesorhizobium tianshanense]